MLVVMSARKNTIKILSILVACLVVGYIYAMAVYSPQKETAQVVSNTLAAADNSTQQDYFEEYRLERDRIRSKQVELLREMVDNANTSASTRQTAQKKLLNIVEIMDTEAQAERILIARGFKDAVVFVRPENVTVVIKGYSVIQQDADKVKEVVSQLTGISNEGIIVLSKR